MLWINFLHFYQPATLADDKTIEAIEKSYLRIIKILKRHPNIKFTININGCLLERIAELGYHELLSDLKELIKKGQIEIVGSASFHPILPLIPEDEARKQIEQQKEFIKKYLGDVELKGFFLPEMAYSAKVAILIKKLGYQWLILDEISANGRLDKNDLRKPQIDSASGLTALFRQKNISQSYVPQQINNLIKQKSNATIITATDAELYGLRHADRTGSLEKISKTNAFNTQTISEFIKNNAPEKTVKLVSSSWESTAEELKNGQPFALWYNDDNVLQGKLWKLAKLSWGFVKKYSADKECQWAQYHLNRGLASCTFWWASGNTLPLWETTLWNPDEIEKGADELIRAIRSLHSSTAHEEKILSEDIYGEIKKMIWTTHWTTFWKR
ncbi:MAG: polysaccharide deacetylase family protein [bacterium]|nr:polysaccharide deacetylase family protein [bacterium]